MSGILYLENRLAPGVFSADRLEVLKVLMSQIAISIENARLYEARKEAEEKYKIETIADLQKMDFEKIDAIIISTPPDIHNQYIKLAIEKGKPAFVEASVVLGDLEKLEKEAKEKNVFIAPSCTSRFHPALKKIKEIVSAGTYGKVTNFSYYMGMYLPDWHPWESVKNFYVGKKETGGGREMVPFELTWVIDIFGFPKDIKGFLGKTMDLGADIDDTYAFSMDFGDKYGTMLIDVVSRFATRSLTLNLEKAQILWKWDQDLIKIYDADAKEWKNETYSKGLAQEGYNENLAEDMYIDELKTFISALEGKSGFPNSLGEDIKILKLLKKIEEK